MSRGGLPDYETGNVLPPVEGNRAKAGRYCSTFCSNRLDIQVKYSNKARRDCRPAELLTTTERELQLMANPHSSTSRRDVSPVISADELRRLFHYDPETGIFTRRTAVPARNGHIGAVVGFKIATGYAMMRIPQKLVFVHRMAWLYMHGYCPAIIDHVNGDRADNRICNLREVTNQENAQNIKKCRNTNRTGVLGAFKNGSGFSSCIKHNGKQIYLGYFKTAEEAHQAYLKAKREMHPCNTL